jgi:hypothetical protein
MLDITLPFNGWTPRPHQMKLWNYLRSGGKRAVAVWHRRAGKDDVMLHATALAMVERPANYWHLLPEFEQGRRAIWSAVNPHTGKRRIDECFPQALRDSTNDQGMFLRLKNGSTWSVIGSDRYDATVGSGVAGIVYSEFALANPSAWAYHRPILEENNGWAAFISTPRGRNHLLSIYNHARTDPRWFAELLTVKDTDALSEEALATALTEYCALYGRDAGMASYRQEYFCDFAAAVLGAFFAVECRELREEGRILAIDAMPDQYVHRSWDIGVKDDTSLWFWQQQGSQLLILDCYSASGVGLEHYLEVIEAREKEHGWMRGVDFVPHDAKVKEWGTGKTRVETMQQLGLKPMLVPMASLMDGINAARRTLPLCVFHPRTEEVGIAALEQYRREWDDDKKAFKASPLHDWSSNLADSFRYLAQSWRTAPQRQVREPERTGFVIPMPGEPKRGSIRL